MKKIFLSLLVMAFTITAAFAQKSVTKNYRFDNITGIDASYTYNVKVTKGNSDKVEVICPDYLEEYLDIKSFNGILYLRMQLPRNFRHPRNSSQEIVVNMQMKSIRSIELSGASSISAQGEFTTDNMSYDLSGASSARGLNISGRYIKVDCSGASNLTQTGSFGKMDLDCSGASKLSVNGDIAEISGEVSGATQFNYNGTSTNIDMEASGASKATLKGRAKSVKYGCSGASYINSKEMQAENASVSASGASKVSIYATQVLKADASASSSVSYYGSPKQIITKPSNIRKAD